MSKYITKTFNPVDGVDAWLDSFEVHPLIVGYSYADFGLIVTVFIDENKKPKK